MELRMHFDFKKDANNDMYTGTVSFCPFLGYKNDTLECMRYREAASEMCGCGVVNEMAKYTMNTTYPGFTPVTDFSMRFLALAGELFFWSRPQHLPCCLLVFVTPPAAARQSPSFHWIR